MVLKWIDDFLALAECKHFSAAADSIYISQSALSKHIKALENDLGVVLFIRSNSKAELTDAGKVFLEYALNVRKLTHDLGYKLDKVAISTHIRHLSIGTIPCITEIGLMQSLISFQEVHSNYSLSITESDQSHLQKLVSEREADAAICRLDFLSDSDYELLPLVEDEMVLVCSKTMFPFESGSEIDLSALRLGDVYTITKESFIYKLAQKQLKEVGYEGDFAGTFPRHMMIFPILVQKKGCALLPKLVVNLQMFPQLTYYRIRNPVKSHIGLIRPNQVSTNLEAYENTSELFDYFRSQGKKE